MVPYNDFQLTERQIDLVKRLHQRRAIRQYIKENGVEPDSALVQSWYAYTEKEFEAHRLAYYSVMLTKGSNVTPEPEPEPDDELPIGFVNVPNNEVWYKSLQNKVIAPKYLTEDAWGANLVSNAYEDGFGKMKFDGDVLTVKQGTLLDNNLTEIYFPNTVVEIERHAIGISNTTGGGYYLQKIQLGKNLSDFSGGSIWCYTNNLSSIILHPGNEKFRCVNDCLIEISSGTLVKGCVNSIIPNNVTVIGGDAFWGSRISSVVLPESVTKIDGEAFSHCSFSSIDIPSSLEYIGGCAFECSNITSITLTNTVKQIDSWGFHSSKLSWANIDVELIENGAFGNCTLLTAVTFGKSVKKIGDNSLGSQHKVFAGCINLNNINYLGTIEEWENISFGDNWYSDDVPAQFVHCSNGDIELRPTEQVQPTAFTLTITGDSEWNWSGQILTDTVYSGDWVIAGDWSVYGEWAGGSSVECPITEEKTVKSISGIWQRVSGSKVLNSQPTVSVYVNNVCKVSSFTPKSYGTTYASFGSGVPTQFTVNPGDHVIVIVSLP